MVTLPAEATVQNTTLEDRVWVINGNTGEADKVQRWKQMQQLAKENWKPFFLEQSIFQIIYCQSSSESWYVKNWTSSVYKHMYNTDAFVSFCASRAAEMQAYQGL